MAHILQTIRQDRRLIMNLAMRRAFSVLQMPNCELSDWLYCELGKNPVFEVTQSNTSQHFDWIQKKDSFYEYLAREIILHFPDHKEREIAYFIAGSLDAKGFLTLSHKTLCNILKISDFKLKNVLSTFHQIEPIGLGAESAREALLLQLAHQGRSKSSLYHLINKHFDDLLHNRLNLIAKEMHVSIKELQQLISHQLKALDPFPGCRFSSNTPQSIIPDLIIHQEDGYWKVAVPGDYLPQFHIDPHYIQFLKQSTPTREERDFIRRHLASGKWLIRTLDRRNKILMAIGCYVLKRQRSFLEGESAIPFPLKRAEAAVALELSTSTITRAIHRKYVETPRGLIQLNLFFPRAFKTKQEQISPQRAKTLIGRLIEKEEKQDPFSDQALSDHLRAHGIFCARRTVAKYRQELKISPKYRRKEWI